MFIWAVSSVAVWAVLQLLAVKWCTDWRDEKVKYGFLVLAGLVWYVPDVLVGSSGAKAVEQILFVAGFPIAAIYCGGLLVAEVVERRKEERLKADS